MTDRKNEPLKPGEKVFTVLLLAVSLFMLAQALLLWRAHPGIAGPAAVPLLSSALVAVLLTVSVFLNIKKPSAAPSDLPPREKARMALNHVFSLDLLIALAAIIAYCALIALGVSFYIVTPVFLWGLTTFFARGGYLKNLLPTTVCVAFVYVVFELLFHISLP